MAKQNSVENKFIVITAILVLLLSVPTFNTLFFDNQIQLVELTTLSSDEGDRSPASINSTITQYYTKPVALEIDCNKLIEKFVATGTQVRIKAKGCQFDKLKIENLSNGFTASVFKESNHTVSTDFIDLNEGLNKLKISFENSNKEVVEREFFVQRDL